MTKSVFILSFLLLFCAKPLKAEILSIPEDCFAKEISPCLIKSSEKQILKNPSAVFAFTVEENTIFKVIQFKVPYQFELLQGKMSVQAPPQKRLAFQLNHVPFDSNRLFAEIIPEKKMRVYDSRQFVLSDYDLPRAQGEEVVLAKSEFLAKIEMIRYLSNYFSSKKSLRSYLNSIQSRWKKEFQAQTNDQTMALKRSIASVEKNEADEKRRREEEARELKKVRELFFYRTFYR